MKKLGEVTRKGVYQECALTLQHKKQTRKNKKKNKKKIQSFSDDDPHL